ncbi:hypothetical protein EVAR_41824_1 [Eumeta japonica]|uniref:Uncharacterized protein n=1 Tax=Eumeta variegata TaxID=151549 RepID=A0A4C1XCG8_EUMVA|nr:hypothetical protein EVAR_41824_1 [Eumeta japonica]
MSHVTISTWPENRLLEICMLSCKDAFKVRNCNTAWAADDRGWGGWVAEGETRGKQLTRRITTETVRVHAPTGAPPAPPGPGTHSTISFQFAPKLHPHSRYNT